VLGFLYGRGRTPDGKVKVATTHRITNVIKVAEFADLYESFSTMDKSEACYWRVIELIQKQTEAKQAKWWAYYDERRNRVYQDELTKRLIEAEKASAQ